MNDVITKKQSGRGQRDSGILRKMRGKAAQVRQGKAAIRQAQRLEQKEEHKTDLKQQSKCCQSTTAMPLLKHHHPTPRLESTAVRSALPTQAQIQAARTMTQGFQSPKEWQQQPPEKHARTRWTTKLHTIKRNCRSFSNDQANSSQSHRVHVCMTQHSTRCSNTMTSR